MAGMTLSDGEVWGVLRLALSSEPAFVNVTRVDTEDDNDARGVVVYQRGTKFWRRTFALDSEQPFGEPVEVREVVHGYRGASDVEQTGYEAGLRKMGVAPRPTVRTGEVPNGYAIALDAMRQKGAR
jgi:hypothetical protein